MELNVRDATVKLFDWYSGGPKVEVSLDIIPTGYIMSESVSNRRDVVSDEILDAVQRWVDAKRGH